MPLESCGVKDGSTVHVMEWPRGGGKHKDKRSQEEKKQVAGQESVRDMGPAIPESEKDKVIQLSEEKDESISPIQENSM